MELEALRWNHRWPSHGRFHGQQLEKNNPLLALLALQTVLPPLFILWSAFCGRAFSLFARPTFGALDLLCDEQPLALLIVHRHAFLLERRLLLLESLRAAVNLRNEPTFICLVYVCDASTTEVFDELDESHPAGHVHM